MKSFGGNNLVARLNDRDFVKDPIGRKGGHIGGKRRLKTMTKAERTNVARKAAKTRWKKARHSAR